MYYRVMGSTVSSIYTRGHVGDPGRDERCSGAATVIYIAGRLTISCHESRQSSAADSTFGGFTVSR